MTARRKDLWSGAVFIGFAVFIYISSFGIRKLFFARIGAAFVPQLSALLLAGLAVILIIQALLRKEETGEPGTPPADGEPVPGAKSSWLSFPVAATSGLLLAYVILLGVVGFLVTTVVYLFLQFIVLAGDRKKNLAVLALISVVTSGVVYALFVYGFELMLPAGILG